MSTGSRAMILAIALVLLGHGHAQAQSSSPISIENLFGRSFRGAKVAQGYMTITNAGIAADRLVSAASPAAGKVEIDDKSMHELAGGLPIGAGKTVTLSPGGNFLMLALKAPLRAGDSVPVTLTFENAGKVEVTLDVQLMGRPPRRDFERKSIAPAEIMPR